MLLINGHGRVLPLRVHRCPTRLLHFTQFPYCLIYMPRGCSVQLAGKDGVALQGCACGPQRAQRQQGKSVPASAVQR